MCKQSHPIAAFREVVFHLTTSAGAPLTGQTFSGAEIQLRKPLASAYVNADATQQTAVVEIGAGDYVYTYTVGEIDTPGTGFAFKVNKSGALLWTATDEIERAYFATAVAGTLSTTSFTSNRTEATDGYWKDCLTVALSGANIGQVKKIGGYTGASKLVTLATGYVFTSAVSAGDVFELLDR